MAKEFNVTKSEIKKAERFASKRDNKQVKAGGYFAYPISDDCYKVVFEMLSDDFEVREEDVVVYAFLPDRRKSWLGYENK